MVEPVFCCSAEPVNLGYESKFYDCIFAIERKSTK